jgi:hypothetical protein
MKAIKGIFVINSRKPAIRTPWLDRNVSTAYDCLAYIVDTIQKVSLVIIRLGNIRRLGQYGRKYLGHDILAKDCVRVVTGSREIS